MKIVLFPRAELAARGVARFVTRAIQHHRDIVLGLPTGRTMIPVYEEIVRLSRKGRTDFRAVRTFNLDEFVGLPADHPGTFRSFMRQHFLDHVNLPRSSAHFPGPDTGGPRGYDSLIAEAGGLDLCLLGIGTNGHLGFNEPARRLRSATHQVRLLPATRRANAYLFSSAREVPRTAISMGIGTILNARTVVLIATGTSKARIVRRALSGPVTTQVPASLIQTHPNALVVLDRTAARGLRLR